jgi:hypothetical protein
MYYDDFGPKVREAFIKFYEGKQGLYKRHEKKYLKEYKSEYTYLANTFVPHDLDKWFKDIGKTFDYEKTMYAKIDLYDIHTLIISYYWLSNEPKIQKRVIFDLADNGEGMEVVFNEEYVIKSVGTSPYALIRCDGRYHMGGWTDYDKFYSHKQKRLDQKSYQILKDLPFFKYIPLEKLKFINPYLLIDNSKSQELLYQIEVLIKMGKAALATDIHLDRHVIEPKYFKHFKTEIVRGIRLDELKYRIAELERKEREGKIKVERKHMASAFAKMPKMIYDLGRYIIRHPNDVKELETEGRVLHHCVSSYLERIVNNESEVMLFRKKENPDEPYFTIELQKERVIQVRTFKNQTDPEVETVVKDWAMRHFKNAVDTIKNNLIQ